jgi:hypothetical protein
MVPLGLLLSGADLVGELDPEVAAVLGGLLGDPLAAGDAVAALRRYSLVTPAGVGMVLMHRPHGNHRAFRKPQAHGDRQAPPSYECHA